MNESGCGKIVEGYEHVDCGFITPFNTIILCDDCKKEYEK